MVSNNTNSIYKRVGKNTHIGINNGKWYNYNVNYQNDL